jgi:hypothetical protein
VISKNRKCPQGIGLGLVAALVVAGSAPTVQAKQAEPATTTPAVAASTPAASASAPTPAPPPPPYSLPWQLRPVVAANVVRSDTAVSFYENGTENASTVASTLLLSYKVLPKLAPLVRLAFVHNNPGTAPWFGNAVVNPLVGATYQLDLAPGLRMGPVPGRDRSHRAGRRQAGRAWIPPPPPPARASTPARPWTTPCSR